MKEEYIVLYIQGEYWGLTHKRTHKLGKFVIYIDWRKEIIGKATTIGQSNET